jgi:hypothetical protein
MIVSVSVEFSKFRDLGTVVTALQGASWKFADDILEYSFYMGDNDEFDNVFKDGILNWPSVESLLTEKLQQGYSITLLMSDGRNAGTLVTVLDSKGIAKLTMHFFGPVRTLPDCGKFADFGIFTRSIACPIRDSGHIVLKVTYEDDFD